MVRSKAAAGLILLPSCSALPDLSRSGDSPVTTDLGPAVVQVLPEVAQATSNLLQTFVVTAVVVALVFPAARFAAVGVFVAFYEWVARLFRPRQKEGGDKEVQ